LVNLPEQPLPIDHFTPFIACETSIFTVSLRGIARFVDKLKLNPIISFKVMLPFQRTFLIFVSYGNAGHTTQQHITSNIKNALVSAKIEVFVFIFTFVLN
jgi:hypothetical protein